MSVCKTACSCNEAFARNRHRVISHPCIACSAVCHLFSADGIRRCHVQASWRTNMYSMQMLVPALDAFELCWRDTDALFATMPDWSVQPISMRHPFGFYYGEPPGQRHHVSGAVPVRSDPLTHILAAGAVYVDAKPTSCNSCSLCRAPGVIYEAEDATAPAQRECLSTLMPNLCFRRVNISQEGDRVWSRNHDLACG